MLERAVEDLVGEVVALAVPPGGEVAHVLEDGVEGVDGLLSELLLVQQLLEQRLLDGVARILPQTLARRSPRRRQRDGARDSALRWRSGWKHKAVLYMYLRGCVFHSIYQYQTITDNRNYWEDRPPTSQPPPSALRLT